MSSDPRFEIRWAIPADEPDIRALAGAVAMPGAVSVRFAREPDYMLGTTIMGDPCDVLIARQRSDGQLAGMACRAERQAFINGTESRLGYIGQIRVAPGFRGTWLVQRGAPFFRQASAPGLVYMGVIASDNPRARKVLAGPRLPAGLHARLMTGMTTCAILLRRRNPVSAPNTDVQPATAHDLPEIVEFLRTHSAHRQFFPAYTLKDFTGGERMRGLKPQDILVARRGPLIVGVMAAWDQSAYKQEMLESYGPALLRMRPALDAAARLLQARPLTRPGREIPLAFAACVCVAHDDAGVMRALLSMCMHYARQQGKTFLMLGLADSDPLLAVARRFLHVTYHSELFALAWSEQPLAELDDRIPYVEIATL